MDNKVLIKLKRFLKFDYIVGLIMTIGGAYFAIWISQSIDPVYARTDTRLIFDSKSINLPVKVFLGDSLVEKKNIYSANIYFWNDGGLPIEKKDIRKPISISAANDKIKILSCIIGKQNIEGIANFRVQEQDHRFVFDWDYFDPGFGYSVQLIILSNEENNIDFVNESLVIDGYFLNSNLRDVSYSTQDVSSTYLKIFFLVIVITFVIWIRKHDLDSKKSRIKLNKKLVDMGY